jgi:hypothetical protein
MTALRTGLSVAVVGLLAVAASCGGGDSFEITGATFTHGLTAEQQAADPGSEFAPSETVCLSLTLKGRPKSGTVTAKFYYHDAMIAEAGVDLADVNSGVIVSVGESTYVGYTLTHDEPFPIGTSYRADVYYGGTKQGTYPFSIVPPTGAIPSKIASATLARGRDDNYDPVDPTTVFAPDEVVYLVVRGDFGLSTWVQADWYVGGVKAKDATRSFTFGENAADTGLAFSFLPEGGWPPGEHEVVLTMNGEEAGRYRFTIEEQTE